MIKNLNKKMERLFDENQKAASLEELKKSFTLAEDNKQLENLSYVYSQKVTRTEMPYFFSQLSSFFELGFFFEKASDQKYHALCLFAYSMQIKNLDGLSPIKLPEPDLFKVLSTNTQSFLSKLNLKDFDTDSRLRSFLIRLSQTETLVLMSTLPDPWAKLRLQSLQQTLMKIHFE